MVFDDVAEEDRDVDITLRVVNEDAGTTLLEGIEVKHHKRPLDVSHVEQLCAKLRDMPAIGNAGIVSGSGYTGVILTLWAGHVEGGGEHGAVPFLPGHT